MAQDRIYEVVAEATQANSSIAAGVAETANVAAMMSQSFEALEFDSLNYMELCIAIAAHAGVSLSTAQVMSLGTPLAVVRHLTLPAKPSGAASPPQLDSFRAWLLSALASCRSQTDYYRVVVDIEMTATPSDVEFLVQTGGPWSAEFKDGLDKLYESMLRVQPAVSQHALTAINQSVLLYSDKNSKRRRLVVGFSGNFGGLFLPTPIALQYFPGETDILLLRDPAAAGFGGGMRGYAASFPAIVERLKRDIDFRRYGSVCCIGISAGGCAALSAGVLLNADKAVSFSGRLPSRAVRAGSRFVPPDLENVLRTNRGDRSRFFSVFGADNAKDVANSQAIAKFFALTEKPIAGIKDHKVVWQLHLQGALHSLLRELELNT